MKKIRVIPYAEFQQYAKVCSTQSALYRPCANEKTYIYERTVGEFLKCDVFPVYFINSNGTHLVSWDQPDAHPILFSDFVRRSDFMHQLLDDWYNEKLGPITLASVISLRCIECGRSIVIDGVHRLAWLGANQKYDEKVTVTELSGSLWPKETPDLNVVCQCKR